MAQIGERARSRRLQGLLLLPRLLDTRNRNAHRTCIRIVCDDLLEEFDRAASAGVDEHRAQYCARDFAIGMRLENSLELCNRLIEQSATRVNHRKRDTRRRPAWSQPRQAIENSFGVIVQAEFGC